MDALNEYALWGGIGLFSGREHLHPEIAQLQAKYDTVVKRAGKSVELPDHNRADRPIWLGRDIVHHFLKNRTICRLRRDSRFNEDALHGVSVCLAPCAALHLLHLN